MVFLVQKGPGTCRHKSLISLITICMKPHDTAGACSRIALIMTDGILLYYSRGALTHGKLLIMGSHLVKQCDTLSQGFLNSVLLLGFRLPTALHGGQTAGNPRLLDNLFPLSRMGKIKSATDGTFTASRNVDNS